jgi:hypothetical protein
MSARRRPAHDPASFVGIFAIPPLHVVFQAIREKLRPGSRPTAKALAPDDIATAHETPAE